MAGTVDSIKESNRDSLVQSSMLLLESRARGIASQVERMLDGTLDDLDMLAGLPVDDDIYLDFQKKHQGRVWVRTGGANGPGEFRGKIPLYREVVFADVKGNQVICIRDGKVVAGEALSSPRMGAYGVEDYFSRAMALEPGDVYVSHLAGFHVAPQEQLNGAQNVEDALKGKAYSGVVRFARKRFVDGKLQGIVCLGLDHSHLMEFTQHVLPFGNDEVLFPSYSSGNYAFMFDDQGWMLTHPKFWDIRGVDRTTGQLVDPVSSVYTQENIRTGRFPFNLFHVPFIHENYQYIAKEVTSGRAGVTRTSSVGGISRILAYAPVRFHHGDYRTTGCFGGITLGANTEVFLKTVEENFSQIDGMLKKTARNNILMIILTGLVVAVIAIFIANSFMRPIRFLTVKAKEISSGYYDDDIFIKSGDELEVLGLNFREMGIKLKQHEQHLVRSLNDLEQHVAILKSIHSGSHLLTFSLNREKVYDVILKTCVDGIGFKRAILYMIDEDPLALSCVKTYGFDGETSQRLCQEKIHLELESEMEGGSDTLHLDEKSRVLQMYSLISIHIGQGEFSYAPVSAAGTVTGILGVDLADDETAIVEKKTESLQIIANEAGMAIARALLMEDSVKGREFIESILSNILSGLVVFDQKGTILTANPKAQDFFGLTHEELINADIASILKPYPDILRLINMKSVDETGYGASLDLNFPGQKLKHLELFISLLSGAPETNKNSRLLIIRDVTERKNMEKHLSRSDKLVSLGVLAAGIAHEIRNPLTGITLMLDDLHDRMANRTEDRLMIQRALEAIEKLENIVTRLLEFASKPAHQPFRANINKVIDDTLFFVKKQCKQQGVLLIKNTGENLPDVYIDQERIRQAILNIVLNALNVLDRGGEITIATRFARATDAFPGGGQAVILTIADNGPGISKEDINYIFDPFFSHNPDGFGLGLSITHTIIQEHGGKILVDSEPGKGTSFDIYLPISDTNA